MSTSTNKQGAKTQPPVYLKKEVTRVTLKLQDSMAKEFYKRLADEQWVIVDVRQDIAPITIQGVRIPHWLRKGKAYAMPLPFAAMVANIQEGENIKMKRYKKAVDQGAKAINRRFGKDFVLEPFIQEGQQVVIE